MAAPVVDAIETLCEVDPRALDDDALRALAVELAHARSRLDALELATVAEFDQRDAYVADGMTSVRAWLAHHTGVERKTAGATVWLAKRLRYMPAFAAALENGEIRSGHARVMARALNPRTLDVFVRDEAMLVGHATALEVDDFAHVVARWLFLADPSGVDPGNEKPSELHVSPMLDGRNRVDGELDLEDSVEYLAELDRRYEQIYAEDHSATASDQERNRTRSQRYAAAQVEMARRSSAADEEGRPGRKPLVIVRADVAAIAGDPTAEIELDDGTPLPPEILERWLCDSAISRVVLRGKSLPMDLGAITYTATDGQRRVLNVRDKGCIVPGCKRKARWCDAHHVVPWPQGPTNIDNLVLLCKRHHKHVHRRIIVIVRDPNDGFIVTRADGTRLYERPPPDIVAA